MLLTSELDAGRGICRGQSPATQLDCTHGIEQLQGELDKPHNVTLSFHGGGCLNLQNWTMRTRVSTHLNSWATLLVPAFQVQHVLHCTLMLFSWEPAAKCRISTLPACRMQAEQVR